MWDHIRHALHVSAGPTSFSTTSTASRGCRNLTLVWFAFGGGRGPPGLLADLSHPTLAFSGTVLLFRAIHLTIFWGTDRGHVGNVQTQGQGTGTLTGP